MTHKRPTAAQLRVLRNLAQGLDAFRHLKTMSDHGGAEGTIRAMTRRGWLIWHENAWRLTEAGRELARGGNQQ